jgi:type I restriction enzyme S subunit
MNADQLLAHYERVAEAPDAIARLRRFILDLAVRGKLVPQDPNDEPASELLNRIAEQKARLGLKAASSPTSKVADLPNGWGVSAIGSYAIDVFTGPFGSMLHQSDYVNGGIPLVNPSHMKNDRIEHDPKVSVTTLTAKRMTSCQRRSKNASAGRSKNASRLRA